nr:unnamed protein product [Callosobruchus chinensis]
MIIYLKGKNINTSVNLLQSQLNKLELWCQRTGLFFSPEKTKSIIFSKKTVHQPLLTLQNSPISYTNEIKFLGLIFDHRLTWKTHIKELVESCHKRMNVLKCLSNKCWGADGKTLLSIYRHLIRSKIDYGCMVYASAKCSTLKQLDSIHHAALRLILGAYRTTPTDSLYCESGEAPLYLRRQILSISMAAKSTANPSLASRSIHTNARNIDRETATRHKCFHQRVQTYLHNLDIERLATPIPVNTSTTPPGR